MSFLSDVLRVGAVVAAPVLMATGVGAVVVAVAGTLIAAGSNAAAEAIDRANDNAKADKQAAKAQEEANQACEAKKQEALAEMRAQEVALQRQLVQAALPQKLLTACQNGDLATVQALLAQLDDKQITQLALTPLSACKDADTRAKVKTMLNTEKKNRLG